MNKHLFAEIAGWYGAAAILLAYALLTFAVLSSTSLLFQFMNFTGAVGFIIIGHVKKVYPTVVLNVVWAIIALMALVRFV